MVTRLAPMRPRHTPRRTDRGRAPDVVIDLTEAHALDRRARLDPSAPADRRGAGGPASAGNPTATPPAVAPLLDARTGEVWVPERATTPASSDAHGVARPPWVAGLLLVVAAVLAPVGLVAVAATVSDPRVAGLTLVLGLWGLAAAVQLAVDRGARATETERGSR